MSVELVFCVCTGMLSIHSSDRAAQSASRVRKRKGNIGGEDNGKNDTER